MQTIIDVLDFSFKESIDQSNTFTKEHKRYDVRIRNNLSNVLITFEYQCNANNEPNLDDCLWCLVCDYQSYESCNDDLEEFQREFGIESVNECIRVFNGCKDNYNKLLKLCGSYSTVKWLEHHYEDY